MAVGPTTCSPLSSFMPVGFQSEIQSAFSAWSSVANLTFVQEVDNGVPSGIVGTNADIRISGFDLCGGCAVLAFAAPPPPPLAIDSTFDDIFLDSTDVCKLGFGGLGFSIFQVVAHKLGHALGLDHTFVPDSLMNFGTSEAFIGPQADDIAGIQALYGSRAIINAVPEPTTLALLGLALAALGLRRRSAQRHA